MTVAPLNRIVVEPVLLVPKGQVFVVAGGIGHRVRDEEEMFEELGRSAT